MVVSVWPYFAGGFIVASVIPFTFAQIGSERWLHFLFLRWRAPSLANYIGLYLAKALVLIGMIGFIIAASRGNHFVVIK